MQNSVDSAKIKESQFEDPSTNRKLSINILIEEAKPIVMKKNELE